VGDVLWRMLRLFFFICVDFSTWFFLILTHLQLGHNLLKGDVYSRMIDYLILSYLSSAGGGGWGGVGWGV